MLIIYCDQCDDVFRELHDIVNHAQCTSPHAEYFFIVTYVIDLYMYTNCKTHFKCIRTYISHRIHEPIVTEFQECLLFYIDCRIKYTI